MASKVGEAVQHALVEGSVVWRLVENCEINGRTGTETMIMVAVHQQTVQTAARFGAVEVRDNHVIGSSPVALPVEPVRHQNRMVSDHKVLHKQTLVDCGKLEVLLDGQLEHAGPVLLHRGDVHVEDAAVSLGTASTLRTHSKNLRLGERTLVEVVEEQHVGIRVKRVI